MKALQPSGCTTCHPGYTTRPPWFEVWQGSWRYSNTKYLTIFQIPFFDSLMLTDKGWGLSAKLGKHSAIWGKLGTALQVQTLNPWTKFPPNPTSKKVNTEELTSQHPAQENIKNKEKHSTIWGKLCTAVQGYTLNPCTRFPPNPTSTKVNTDELTFEHPAQENIEKHRNFA